MDTNESSIKRKYKYLTPYEKSFLKDNYLYLTDKELGAVLDRTPTNIRKLRQLLGLSRVDKKNRPVAKDVPIVIWMPSDAFEQYDVDLDKLKITKRRNDESN